jgi:hypothetical protein
MQLSHQFIFANVTKGVFLCLVCLHNDQASVLASKSEDNPSSKYKDFTKITL